MLRVRFRHSIPADQSQARALVVWLVTALSAMACACKKADEHHPRAVTASPANVPVPAAAESVVSRFLAADTSGDFDGAIALATAGMVDDELGPCDYTYDAIEVVESASLVTSTMVGDTAVFGVEFRTLGVGVPGDPAQAGPKYWRFYGRRAATRTTVRVAQDSTGRMRVVCDPSHPPMHRGLAYWAPIVPLLGDSSLAEWRSVAPKD
jgi:hypothetical protein